MFNITRAKMNLDCADIVNTCDDFMKLDLESELNLDVNMDEELKYFSEMYGGLGTFMDDGKNSDNGDNHATGGKTEAQGTYLCKNCNLTYAARSYLLEHMRHCRKKGICVDKQYKCSDCNYQTDKRYSLKLHKYTHSNQKRFSCEICKKGFNRCDTYRNHMFEHKNQKKPFQCPKCDYAAISSSHLKSHMGYKHSTEKPLQCSTCGFRCVNSSGLKSHMLTHRDAEASAAEEKIKCDHCDYSTVTRRKRDLLEHIKRKHTSDRPFACESCDYKAVTLPALKQHKKNKHSQDKRFKCITCNYQTMVIGDYMRHIERKHGYTQKMLKCDECDFTTAYKNSLGSHKKARHSNLKSFECDRCEYKSATKEYLKRHMNMHSENKITRRGNCMYQSVTMQQLLQIIENVQLRPE